VWKPITQKRQGPIRRQRIQCLSPSPAVINTTRDSNMKIRKEEQISLHSGLCTTSSNSVNGVLWRARARDSFLSRRFYYWLDFLMSLKMPTLALDKCMRTADTPFHSVYSSHVEIKTWIRIRMLTWTHYSQTVVSRIWLEYKQLFDAKCLTSTLYSKCYKTLQFGKWDIGDPTATLAATLDTIPRDPYPHPCTMDWVVLQGYS